MTDVSGRYAISVDVGGTRTKVGLYDFERKEVGPVMVEPTVSNSQQFLELLQRAFQTVTSGLTVRPLGVGIAVPGFVDTERARISDVWDDLRFMQEDGFAANTALALGLPCFWDNDARCVALGEFHGGAGVGARRLLSLTLGTGVGFAFLIDGRFPEASHVTHLGAHFPIRTVGPQCWCGLKGCFEALVSSSGLMHRVPEDVRPELASDILASKSDGHGLTTAAVTDYLADLQLGLEVFARTLAPDVIVIGGGVSRGLCRYLSRLQIAARPYAGYEVAVRVSELQESSGIIGAAYLAAAMSIPTDFPAAEATPPRHHNPVRQNPPHA